MFKHPKHYKELEKIRKQFEKEQADKATSHKLPGPRPISNANKGLIHRKKSTSAQAQADKRPSHKPKGSGANLPSQEK